MLEESVGFLDDFIVESGLLLYSGLEVDLEELLLFLFSYDEVLWVMNDIVVVVFLGVF